MGTNYYARLNECGYCGRFDELHLGKASARWCFSLHVYPEKGINTLTDLLKYIKDVSIYDEDGDNISEKDFVNIVTKRNWSNHPSHNKNNFFGMVEIGPNNLLRHTIDGQFCIGHGEGTWDYLIGDFS